MMSFFLFALFTVSAWADSTRVPVNFEAALGYEAERLDFDSHQDHSRGGLRLSIKIEDLKLEKSFKSGANASVVFVPLRVVFSDEKYGSGFGRVTDHEAGTTRIRRMTGALVQTSYVSEKAGLFARAKLVSFDYDRDRGFWDWRALDASLGVRLVHTAGQGHYVLSIAPNVGTGVGGLELRNLDEVEEALGIEPVRARTNTLTAYAGLVGALRTPRLKIEILAQTLRRIELKSADSAQPKYLGRQIHVESSVFEAAVDAEYFMKGRAGLSAYGNVAYQRDSLTLSQVLFGAHDSFQSVSAFTGIRTRF